MKYLLVGIGMAIVLVMLVAFKVTKSLGGTFCAYTGNPGFAIQCYPTPLYFGLWGVGLGCLVMGGLLFARKS